MKIERSYQRLLELGARLSGQRAGFAGLEDQLRPTVKVADWSHLQGPVAAPVHGYFFGGGAPPASNYAWGMYVAPPEGAFLLMVTSDSTTDFQVVSQPGPAPVLTAGTVTASTAFNPQGGASRGTWSAGHTLINLMDSGLTFNGTQIWTPGLFIEGGRYVAIGNEVAAQAINVSMVIQEVPV